MSFKQFIILTFATISLVLSPLAATALVVVILVCHALKANKYLIIGSVLPISMLLLGLGMTFEIPVTLPAVVGDFVVSAFHSVSYPPGTLLSRYLISDPISIGVSLAGTAIASALFLKSPQQAILERHAKKAKAWIRGVVKWVGDRSTLIFGVSSSGKTALINRIAKAIFDLADDSIQIWIDGKGSTENHSLYDTLSRICKEAGRELVVINGTDNPRLGNTVYNFLDGVGTPDQAADMIMCLISNPQAQATDGSEHYKVMTKAYLIAVIRHMMDHGIPLTLFNVVTLMDPETMEEKLSEDTKTSLKDRNELLDFMKDSWDDVRDSHIKLNIFIRGEGRKIFTKDGNSAKESTSIKEAYKKERVSSY